MILLRESATKAADIFEKFTAVFPQVKEVSSDVEHFLNYSLDHSRTEHALFSREQTILLDLLQGNISSESLEGIKSNPGNFNYSSPTKCIRFDDMDFILETIRNRFSP